MHCTFAPRLTIQVITGNCQSYTRRCNYLTMMTTSSLPMGLIINSLVMPPVRSESAPSPSKLASYCTSPSEKECDNELLCYIWQMIAGPIHHYLDNPLLAYWFPKSDDFYTTASNFIRNNEPGQPTDDQTALIPWVQSIVIKHYVLGKEVFFQGQDNYVDLYRYLNDFLALYLTLRLISYHWQRSTMMPRISHLLRK